MAEERPGKLIAGNWKMFGVQSYLEEARALAAELQREPAAARVAICPPATLLHRAAQAVQGTPLLVGGQDCHVEAEGAFTGDVSAEMLADAGATLVVLGHSERRTAYTEDDALISGKVEAALRAGLEPIVCVGETLEQRDRGDAADVVRAQTATSLPEALRGRAFAVAYEPVWAIGTGLTPTLEEIDEIHQVVRATLLTRFGDEGAAVPILYGGSVKPSNAAEILKVPGVDGALVGGASLKAADFLGIVRAL
ncbi:MAG TPA: triose-phosphate isomerase [Caulobacteraceae bacterium]|jgi:triosephosphate isomerase